jgi:trehalose 6-phosphate phosphatase
MRKAYQQLRERLAPLPGVIVEHKGLTLSVHYRLTPNELVGAVVEAVEEEAYAGDGSTRFKVTRGKQVVELRPDVEWGKGQAIAQLQVTYPEIPLTMFFGDDVTDEDGFDVVMNSGGLAVFVGPPRHPTRALYRLDSPVEVAQVLRLLAAW